MVLSSPPRTPSLSVAELWRESVYSVVGLWSFRPHTNSPTSQFAHKTFRPHIRVNSSTYSNIYQHDNL